MKDCVRNLWLLGLLLLSPLLWAEVVVDPEELKALRGIEANIGDDSYFKKLRRIDDPERRKVFSYVADNDGHVVSLNLSVLEYEDLSFLQAFPKLRFLSISDSKKLTSMHGLESNIRLEKIWLMEVPITRVEGLDKMERLTLLSIHEGQLTSMEGVKNLTALKNLVLSRNKLERFEGLGELEALEFISVKDNPIGSMQGLGSKPNLEDLYIYRTNIRRLEGYDSLIDANIVVDKRFPFGENHEAIQSLKARNVDVYTP